MRVTAPSGIGTAIGGVWPLVARVMKMIGDGFDFAIRVRIERGTGLPFVTGAVDHVEEMRNDAGFNMGLTIFVEVDAPGIAGAFGENFKDLAGRMITENSGVDAGAVLVRGARLADVRVCEH